MEQKEKERIRRRDKYRYCKEHGAVPVGYSMHHLWYSEEYNPDSFIIVSKEEHDLEHGKDVPCSQGFDHYEYYNNYSTTYRKSHEEQCRSYNTNYKRAWREAHREEFNAKVREYRKKKKAEKAGGGNDCPNM